ncbi:hypothetical protein GCK32_017340 [Trichostrongylus colubriformis]|uniref:Uncharacterized protein n=1 Tax=Trichostrongylus colubriformis TaxID=6319 RepID=A0AAN8FDR8_TRICO
MDPNLFGVKIAVKGDQGQELVVSTANRMYKDSLQHQLPNNIREVTLIILQFRAEIGSDVQSADMKAYERSVVAYFQDSYNSEFISVLILTDSFITSEIVRAGLSLLPFLVIGFTIMAIFSSVTFSMSGIVLKQMNIHKMRLVLSLLLLVAVSWVMLNLVNSSEVWRFKRQHYGGKIIDVIVTNPKNRKMVVESH